MSKEPWQKQNLLKRSISRLNDLSIKYSLLSSIDENGNFIGRDVDILCSKNDAYQIAEIFRRLFAEESYIVKTQIKNRLIHFYAINRYYDPASAIQIDLIFYISRKDKIFFSDKSSLKDCELMDIKGLKLAPFYFFVKNFLLQTLVRDFEKVAKMRDSYVYNYLSDNIPLIVKKLELYGIKNAFSFTSLIENKKFEEAYDIISKDDKFSLFTFLFKPLYFSKLFLNAIVFYIYNYFKYADAPFISIVGPDGCGKSTLIKKIQALNTSISAFLKIKSYHLRPSLLPSISRLFFRKKMTSLEEQKPREKAGKLFLIRVLYYSLDYLFGYFLLVKKNLASKKAVIFDRYFLDFYVHPTRFGLSSNKFILKIWKMLPKPQKIFLLKDDSAAIFSRKPELDISEINRQYKIWEKLSIEKKYNIEIISNDSESCKIILREIYRNFFK